MKIISYKIKLKPNNKQLTKLLQFAGASRFAYNWALAKQMANFKEGRKPQFDSELRKEFTQLRNSGEKPWLLKISNNVTKQAIKDCCKAYKNFFSGISKHPKFKNKYKSKKSFYNDTYTIKFNGNIVQLETIGKMEMAEILPANILKYQNPRISYDGVRF